MTGYEKVKSCFWVVSALGVGTVCYKLCGLLKSCQGLVDEGTNISKDINNSLQEIMINANDTVVNTNKIAQRMAKQSIAGMIVRGYDN